jgi:multiple sugar transport system substrate-binding protein
VFLQYAKPGITAELTDLFTPDVRADFSPAAIEAVTVENRIHAVPIEQEPVALFYNKDLLAKANLEVPKTWDELLSACEKLKAANIIPIVIETNPAVYQNFTWYPFLWQTGANVLSDDFTKAIFDSPGAAKALDPWRTLIQKGYAPRTGAADTTAAINSTAFSSGQAAMQVIGVWAVTEMTKNFPNINFGIGPLPTPDGSNPITVYGGWTQMVNAKSKSIETAKEFTSWMWIKGTERPVEWTTKAKSNFSPRKSVIAAAGSAYNEEHLKVFRDDVLPTAKAEPRFPTEVVKIVGDALQSAMFRNTAGEKAAAAAQKRLEAYLKKTHL